MFRSRAGVPRSSGKGRWFARAREAGTALAKVGRFPRVWSSCEDVTMRIADPCSGPVMAHRAVDEAATRARRAVTRSRGDDRAVCADDVRAQRLRDIGWDDRADELASDEALWR